MYDFFLDLVFVWNWKCFWLIKFNIGNSSWNAGASPDTHSSMKQLACNISIIIFNGTELMHNCQKWHWVDAQLPSGYENNPITNWCSFFYKFLNHFWLGRNGIYIQNTVTKKWMGGVVLCFQISLRLARQRKVVCVKSIYLEFVFLQKYQIV